ncbi:MAG: hypothetical protein LBG07_03460, partial [Treponema sp.]|nr:hypothetical protein [Treponema sp.]
MQREITKLTDLFYSYQGAFLRARKNRAFRFNSSTLPLVKSPVFPLQSLALPKNGIHAIFGLYVFALQKRRNSLQPAPRRARPPTDGLAFGRDNYSCRAPGGCYIFSLTPLTRAITSPHAGQRI